MAQLSADFIDDAFENQIKTVAQKSPELEDKFNNGFKLLGQRRALPGEHIVFEIENNCQLTNYRMMLRRPQTWLCLGCCNPPSDVAVDAWLKDITCVEVELV